MARRPPRKARRRLPAAELAPRPARPPDPRLVRRRREALEVELDNQELLRRRAAADAFMADALTPPEPARPAPLPSGSPFIPFPVTRVIHATGAAVYVVAWGLQIWVPKSSIGHHDPDLIREGWAGRLDVSTRWATSVGLPPIRRTA